MLVITNINIKIHIASNLKDPVKNLEFYISASHHSSAAIIVVESSNRSSGIDLNYSFGLVSRILSACESWLAVALSGRSLPISFSSLNSGSSALAL